MRIANFKYEMGDAVSINRWLFSFELNFKSYYEFEVLRPQVKIVCMKILDPGEPYKLDGRPEKKKGGYWGWYCPFGIIFKFKIV